jgi:hypothetical protein
MEQMKRLYPYLITYCLLNGGLDYYIHSQVEEAYKAKAPEKAVFQRSDGTWATMDNLQPEQRSIIDDIVNNT